MAKYQVGIHYTVWIDVEADNETQAIDNAVDTQYDFIDVFSSGATLELNEYEDPIVHKVEE